MKKKLLQQIKTTITTNFVYYLEYDNEQIDQLNGLSLSQLIVFQLELNKKISNIKKHFTH